MTFPRSPQTLKGALVALDPEVPIPRVIVFQYNPESLSRTVKARQAEGGARSEALFLMGPPTESISVDVELDATDQLEVADAVATSLGIHPQLAALEMLVYPSSVSTIVNTGLAAAGIREIVPAEAPMTLFIWGIKRVLPVRLSSLSITEQAYDINLNPIRAKVSFSLDVLTTHDFAPTHPGFALHLAHHVVKEAMAVVAAGSDLGRVGEVL